MSYNYITQYDSPNFTPADQTRLGWGVDRNIIHIDIHWWDDPARNPSFEGTIATLCNHNRGASAHYVATGTGRRVACLVSPDDNSWCTGSDNPYSISIECDPRCRDEDYDVVAELIANIRSAYGDLSLHGHNEFQATACPGNWDLARLDALARTKDGSGDWGVVTNIHQPVIVTKSEATTTVIPFGKKVVDDLTKTGDTITTVGVNGKRVITENVTYVDGVETKRLIVTDITTPAIDEVTTHGTYIPPITEPEPPVVIPDNTLFNWVTKIVTIIINFLKSWRK